MNLPFPYEIQATSRRNNGIFRIFFRIETKLF